MLNKHRAKRKLMKLINRLLTPLTLVGYYERNGFKTNGDPWKLFVIKFIDLSRTTYELKDFVDNNLINHKSKLQIALNNIGFSGSNLEAIKQFIKEN